MMLLPLLLGIGNCVGQMLKDKTLTRQVEAGTGEGNQNDLTLHFGLGDHGSPVDLEVFWLNGHVQTMRRARLDRIIEIRYEASR